jgi:phosphopantothenoylcysteine synthetase/decarboxylase
MGTEGSELSDRRIAHCVTGSVSITEASCIARLLTRHGVEVIPVLTPKATEFVSPMISEWSTGNAVIAILHPLGIKFFVLYTEAITNPLVFLSLIRIHTIEAAMLIPMLKTVSLVFDDTMQGASEIAPAGRRKMKNENI